MLHASIACFNRRWLAGWPVGFGIGKVSLCRARAMATAMARESLIGQHRRRRGRSWSVQAAPSLLAAKVGPKPGGCSRSRPEMGGGSVCRWADKALGEIGPSYVNRYCPHGSRLRSCLQLHSRRYAGVAPASAAADGHSRYLRPTAGRQGTNPVSSVCHDNVPSLRLPPLPSSWPCGHEPASTLPKSLSHPFRLLKFLLLRGAHRTLPPPWPQSQSRPGETARSSLMR